MTSVTPVCFMQLHFDTVRMPRVDGVRAVNTPVRDGKLSANKISPQLEPQPGTDPAQYEHVEIEADQSDQNSNNRACDDI